MSLSPCCGGGWDHPGQQQSWKQQDFENPKRSPGKLRHKVGGICSGCKPGIVKVAEEDSGFLRRPMLLKVAGILNNNSSAEEIAQPVKCLACKDEKLSSISEPKLKSQVQGWAWRACL